MAHTYTNLLIHAVFSTKDRAPILSRELRPDIFSYMAGIIRKLKGTPILINGVEDHVHLLFILPHAVSIADCMEKVKASSSKWANERRQQGARFGWQVGYAAFSVSASNLESVRAYIAEQEERHRKRTFREEVLAFLNKHGIQYDAHYVFE